MLSYLRQKGVYGLLVLLPALISCGGLDDDSEYAYGTQASYFVYHDSVSGELEVARLQDDQFGLNWGSQQAGGEVSAFTLDQEQRIWMWRNGLPGELLEYDPEAGVLSQFSSEIPQRSYQYLASGHKYVAGVDTVSDSLFFMPKKKGATYFTSFGEDPSRIMFNGGKFYLKKGCCSVGIINETALAEYAVADAGMEILSMQLDQDRNVFLILSDSTDIYGQRINANADILTGSPVPIGFSKVEFSPWLNRIYGDELIGNLLQKGTVIEFSDRISGSPVISQVADSAETFTTDFFEGRVYFTWGDSLYGMDLGPDSSLGRWYFPQTLEEGFHFLGLSTN